MELVELQQALHAADPAAVLVSPRVLERVIQHVYKLPHLSWNVPHRDCFVVDRHVLFRHVEEDELDIDPEHLLPPTVILLARPPRERLGLLETPTLLLDYWRRLFHANVHVALERRAAEGKLNDADVRARVEEIGTTEFAEVRGVLVQDSCLLPSADDRTVYTEFAAIYLELRYFAGNLLASHFPGIRDRERIDRLLALDVDAAVLFARTRLAGAPDPVPRADTRSDEEQDYYFSLVRAAEQAVQAGNTVRAAILRTKAARVAPGDLTASTRAQAEEDVQTLVRRLQAALHLSDAEAAEWARDLSRLLDKADQGNHPVEAALLFDLQTVCLDHERDVYTLDVAEWVFSGGKRPIKRPLPSQRIVRISKHLRSAAQRLAPARLSDADRRHFGQLLQEALDRSEERLRARFRPAIVAALQDVGLNPDNAPEEAAFQKVVEELLERISAHGYLTFSDLRDTLSHNQLKLPDLTDPQDFIRGDPLLRLDRRLANLLDGVYRPSEFYMRWIERLTALSFGTWTGRLLTRFVFVPFGAAFVLVEGLTILLDHFKVPTLPALWHYLSIGFVGLFMLALTQVDRFRERCRRGVVESYRSLRGPVARFPTWFVQATGLKEFVRTWAFQLFYWYLFKPGIVFALLYYLFPATFASWYVALLTFLVISFILNSRPGQAVGDLVSQSFVSFYDSLRAGLLPGLFRFVVSLFKQLVEMLEYLLFTVDEWLRFRGGEGRGALVVRTILGALWFPISYVGRFYMVVLVEPCINPIKLPISALAAKIVYPVFIVMGVDILITKPKPLLGSWVLWALAYVTVWLSPDVFGFLFWEISENWSLYKANRRPNLRAVPVGAHGETIRGLLHPGFHSGTVPHLFTRLRRAEQGASTTGDWRPARAHQNALREVGRTVHKFVERDLVALVRQDPSWHGQGLAVGNVALSSNRIRFELVYPTFPDTPVGIEIEERAGWLLAEVADRGWIDHLTREQRQALTMGLASLYKLSGVDFVREQLRAGLPPNVAAYDVTPEAFVLWLDHRGGHAITYDLLDRKDVLEPRAADGSPAPEGPVLDPQQIIFGRAPIPYEGWVTSWHDPADYRADFLGKNLDLLLGLRPTSAALSSITESLPYPPPAPLLASPDGHHPGPRNATHPAP